MTKEELGTLADKINDLKELTDKEDKAYIGEYSMCVYTRAVSGVMKLNYLVDEHLNVHSLLDAMTGKGYEESSEYVQKEREQGLELVIFTAALMLCGEKNGDYPELEIFIERIGEKFKVNS